jgi:hypothetical protein
MSFDPNDWFFQSSYLCSAGDAELFAKWTASLPKRTEDIPYHCGPDAVSKLAAALKLTEAKSVLEVGFNLGHSSMIWLNLGVERLTSLDVSEHPKVTEAANVVAQQAHQMDRKFTFSYNDTELSLPKGAFDLIFIDGDHGYEAVCRDVELGLSLNIPWFLFDDFDPHHGPGVQPAIAHYKLKLVALFPNVALCVPSDGLAKRL